VPPSALREELVALVADRTDLPPALVASWLARPGAGRAGAGPSPPARERDGGNPDSGASSVDAHGGRAGGPGGAAAASLDAIARAERAFLAQCIAVPSEGAQALRDLDADTAFSSELTRRAARHLREHLGDPAEGIDPEDAELAKLIAGLSMNAARGRGSRAALEGESLTLELLRLERDIASARSSGSGDVAPLVARREELRHRRNRAIERAMAETQPAE
jgi:DNA primase